MKRHSYWLVVGRTDKPTSLIRGGSSLANTIAGDKAIPSRYSTAEVWAFIEGRPDLSKYPDLCFQLLGHLEAWHPLITEWRDKLGPPVEGSAKRLEESRCRSRAAKESVSPNDIAEMHRLRHNGLSYRKIAARLGYSKSTVHGHLSVAQVSVGVRAHG